MYLVRLTGTVIDSAIDEETGIDQVSVLEPTHTHDSVSEFLEDMVDQVAAEFSVDPEGLVVGGFNPITGELLIVNEDFCEEGGPTFCIEVSREMQYGQVCDL